MGAKLNFYLWIQTKVITSQVSIHRLLITKLGGFWIEVHSDLNTMGSSFLLSSTVNFHLPAPLIVADYSLLHCDRNKKTAEIWEPEDQKRTREEDAKFWKNAQTPDGCLIKT